MQVRVDRDQAVETARQQCADYALADRFAGTERRVLAHITQIRRHQRQALRAQLQGGRGGQFQFHQLAVGLVQTAAQEHLLR